MAFLNILVNSIEAVEANQGVIRITLHNNKNHYTIILEDNGCGIPPENISNLFEPYFTSKKNGMGLGLATTLNIIKAHFGEIEVHSEVEQGTNFVVSLPQIKAAIEYHS